MDSALTTEPTFHPRVDGICECEVPLTCSVVKDFWCGKCGKNLQALTEEQIRHIENIRSEDDMDDEFYKNYGRYLIGH